MSVGSLLIYAKPGRSTTLLLSWVLFGNPDIFRGPSVGILMGIASGAALIP